MFFIANQDLWAQEPRNEGGAIETLGNDPSVQNPRKATDIQARAVNASHLKTPEYMIGLWGIETPDGLSPMLILEGRIGLDRQIGGFPIQCDFKGLRGKVRVAQCASYQDVDLGLSMVQSGLAVVDRGLVYNTVFEELYLQAEGQARMSRKGIWGYLDNDSKQHQTDTSPYGIIAVVLLAGIALFVGLIALIVRQGFQRMNELQAESIDIFRSEQRLKVKEKYVIASMLASEIESNTSKIEAYLMVYREMLNKINDVQSTPKYMESGDIVQKQPVLDRNVFDSNTDKIDLLTPSLSSKIIHFYARIKTKPDYATLEPDMPRAEAKNLVEQAVRQGEQLKSRGEEILTMIESFRPKSKKAEESVEEKPGLKLGG